MDTKIAQLLSLLKIQIFGKNYPNIYTSGKIEKESTSKKKSQNKTCKIIYSVYLQM